MSPMLCDAHVHFFSTQFFATLAGQRQVATIDAIRHLGWDDPESAEALADRWVAELDAHGVSRAAIIASVPGDEASVADAVARHPARLTGYFMLDPTKDDAENRVMRALEAPIRQIAENSGVEGSIVVGKLTDNKNANQGFDAQAGAYVDMIKAGIIDPAKVVRTALQDAGSIAALLITAEAMITDAPPKEAPGAVANGGGMGGY